jgi:16S rRNA (cytosine1402-N4)-methyltransferase
MIEEVLLYLNLQRGHTAVDCTIGEGGHAVRILEIIGEAGMLIGLDKDEEILQRARERLGERPNVLLKHADFRDLRGVLGELGVEKVDGLLFDLGVSSFHLDNPKRGFSFMSDGPLDMRLDRTQQETAADLVNNLSEEELARILHEYGEEPRSRRIARFIAEARKTRRVTTTGQLKELTVRATGGRHGATHAATRTFQALRIAVNDELASLHDAMRLLPEALRSGGRAVVISFHSLEDRIVKRVLRGLAATGKAQILTRKPVLPSAAEVKENPRSRSAKLRALEVRQQ